MIRRLAPVVEEVERRAFIVHLRRHITAAARPADMPRIETELATKFINILEDGRVQQHTIESS